MAENRDRARLHRGPTPHLPFLQSPSVRYGYVKSPPTTFPRFQDLPRRLRVQIWEYAFGMIEFETINFRIVRFNRSSRKSESARVLVSFLGPLAIKDKEEISRANRESREVFKTRYPGQFTAKDYMAKLRFYPAHTLFLTHELEFPPEFKNEIPFQNIFSTFDDLEITITQKDISPEYTKLADHKGIYEKPNLADTLPLNPLQLEKMRNLREYTIAYRSATICLFELGGKLKYAVQDPDLSSVNSGVLGFRYHTDTEHVEHTILPHSEVAPVLGAHRRFRGASLMGLARVWIVRPGEMDSSPSGKSICWRKIGAYRDKEWSRDVRARLVWQHLRLAFNRAVA